MKKKSEFTHFFRYIVGPENVGTQNKLVSQGTPSPPPTPPTPFSQDYSSKVVEDGEEKVMALVATFHLHLHNKYNRYFLGFLGCETLNLVITVAQVIVDTGFLRMNIGQLLQCRSLLLALSFCNSQRICKPFHKISSG